MIFILNKIISNLFIIKILNKKRKITLIRYFILFFLNNNNNINKIRIEKIK